MADLVNLVLVALVEVRVEVSLLVEGLPAKGACPLRGSVLQLRYVLRREYVTRWVEWTLQRELYLETTTFICIIYEYYWTDLTRRLLIADVHEGVTAYILEKKIGIKFNAYVYGQAREYLLWISRYI